MSIKEKVYEGLIGALSLNKKGRIVGAVLFVGEGVMGAPVSVHQVGSADGRWDRVIRAIRAEARLISGFE